MRGLLGRGRHVATTGDQADGSLTGSFRYLPMATV